ncbi:MULTISPECIES: RibD family protein [Halomonadaceae]|uniref:RibD family protein n=2 Tax=Oceanospirillales TaxID=135619 RepID=UPI00038CA4AD|nr:RibD family protein [Halomonas titanicae]CDG51971.1 Riboflavin biosynthesis protein ribD [Halomonas sp. A3H3]
MMKRIFKRGGVMPESHVNTITLADAWNWLLALRHRRPSDVAIKVSPTGEWQTAKAITAEARELLDCLTPLASRPAWVVAQLGQSMDGRIATESGHSHYINGHESLVHLHRLRALVDAVVVGAGTASADNPQLTVRHVSGTNPMRVVLDPRGRIPSDLALLNTNNAPTLHIMGSELQATASVAHVERCVLPLNASGQFNPKDVVTLLAKKGLPRVLIEGGGITVSQFIEAGAVDRLHLLVAPLLIGSGRPGLQMTPIETLESALRPPMRTFRCGDDTLFDLRLRDTTA